MSDQLLREATVRLAVEAGVLQNGARAYKADCCALGGDLYHAELVAEVHLRLQRLSVAYEKLRAAATVAQGVSVHGFDNEDCAAMSALEEALAADVRP